MSKKRSMLSMGGRLFSRAATPLILAFAGFVANPTVPSQADLTTMLTGGDNPAARMAMSLTASPAGSIQTAELAFTDPILTGSTASAAGIIGPDGKTIAFTGKIGTPDPRPDSERVTRHLKKGRVITVAPVLPPKDFTAGSVLERHSELLLKPGMELKNPMTFLKPSIKGKEYQIAAAFYPKQKKKAPLQVPVQLASLVTNDNPDILATAYAPPPPDYARQSPFASILRDENKRGRFIPPVTKEDHAWAATALPATVFSAEEQRCLAAGIYFEARGESVEGQAAVAQVILNRVRNPTYPDTICGVVYQNQSWRNRCQFSFACDGIRDRVNSPRHWDMAEEIALATTAGKIWLKEVGSSTHYHATYVSPPWARSMRRVGKIGLHIFYVTYGGGWS